MARASGEKVAVPKLATPATLTAGPTASLTGATRRLRVSWKRASLMARGESVVTLPAAEVWSRLARLVPRLTLLRPPTVREFSAETSYKL